MATKKLVDLPFAGGLAKTDLYHVNQAALDKKETLGTLAQFIIKGSDQGFQGENLAVNTTLTAITAQFKQYLFDTTAGNLTFTLPFSGGGAPSGACVMAVNASGANNLTVTYQTGISVVLPPEGYAFLYFEGTHWELADNSVQRLLTAALQLGSSAGAKLTGDASKVNARNAADSTYVDFYAKELFLSGSVNLETYIKYTTSGVIKAVEFIDTDGSHWSMTNVYLSGATIKLKATGTANRLQINVSTGSVTFDHYSGTADDTISAWTNDMTVNKTGILDAEGLLANQWFGLTIAFVSTTSLTFKAGQCPDSLRSTKLKLAADMTKTSSAWAAGSGNGGLNTGAAFALSTEYGAFVIYNPTTGVYDAMYDTYTVTGGVAVPNHALPSGFTKYRMVGWCPTDGSTQFIPFDVSETAFGTVIQSITTPVADIDTNTLTTARRTDAIGVPNGFECLANINALVFDATTAGSFLVVYPDSADTAPSSTVPPYRTGSWLTTLAANINMTVKTNSSKLIAARSDVATTDTYRVSVLYFIWKRF